LDAPREIAVHAVDLDVVVTRSSITDTRRQMGAGARWRVVIAKEMYMKRDQKDSKKLLRVTGETLRALRTAELTDVAGGQFIPTQQVLPTICLRCVN